MPTSWLDRDIPLGLLRPSALRWTDRRSGDILLAKCAKEDHALWRAVGLANWLVCLIVFALLMRYGGRSLGATFVLAAVVHIAIVLGWDLATGEVRTSAIQWTGIVLAAAGVLLMEWGAQ